MSQELEKEWDVILFGTGLTNCLIACLCAKSGKKVLHFDKNPYYGSQWASFSLTKFLSLQKSVRKTITSPDIFLDSAFENVDLCPKLLKCSGKFFEWIVNSPVARYMDFVGFSAGVGIWAQPEHENKREGERERENENEGEGEGEKDKNKENEGENEGENRTAIGTKSNQARGEIRAVPSSKEAVMLDDRISLIEKRKIMKILKSSPLTHSLILQQNLSQFGLRVIYNVLLDIPIPHNNLLNTNDNNDNIEIDLDRKLRGYLEGMGKYGPSPYLWADYGAAEMTSAFARLAAVNGATYILGQHYEWDSRNDNIVKFNEQELHAKYIIAECEYLSDDSDISSKEIFRAIIISSNSIGHPHNNAIVVYPLGNGKVNLIQLCSDAHCCPREYYLTYCWSDQPFNLTQITNDLEIEVVASYEYSQNSGIYIGSQGANEVYFTNGPDGSIDYGNTADEAVRIFKKLFPDEEDLSFFAWPEDLPIFTLS